ncbi:MAG: hypothetical protein K0Q96_2068 [Rubrobacteraceae bacterium]|jgi:hypothetical protein|nr:hypothetical protein [Rubrobacteraceae bacterium]
MHTPLNKILLAAYGSEGTEFAIHAAIRLAKAPTASCTWSMSSGCQDTRLTLPLAPGTLNGNYAREPSEQA